MAVIARFTAVGVGPYSHNDKPTIAALVDTAEQPNLTNVHGMLGVTATESDFPEQVVVIQQGYMRAVPFRGGETWSVGDLLWVVADASGEVSNVRPAAPAPQVYVGKVYKDNGDSTADVVVNVRVLPSIGELSNVKIETWRDGDVMAYDDTNSYWVPSQPHRTVAVAFADTPYTANVFENTVLVDASGGEVEINLPTVATAADSRLDIKKVDLTRNKVIIWANGTLEDDANMQWAKLKLPGECLTLQCDGTQWWVI